MTRVTALLMLLALTATAAACGGDSGADELSTPSATAAVATPADAASTEAAATPDATVEATPTPTPEASADPDGEAVVFAVDLTLTAWENGGERRFGPEIGSVTEGGLQPTALRIACFGERCEASSWVGGAGWGQVMPLTAREDGVLVGETVTDLNCSGQDVPGTETLRVELVPDFEGGSLSGEMSRISSVLEFGGCRYSSETRDVTGSLTERGTCRALLSGEVCLPFLVGEDHPSHFDRPDGWPTPL